MLVLPIHKFFASSLKKRTFYTQFVRKKVIFVESKGKIEHLVFVKIWNIYLQTENSFRMG